MNEAEPIQDVRKRSCEVRGLVWSQMLRIKKARRSSLFQKRSPLDLSSFSHSYLRPSAHYPPLPSPPPASERLLIMSLEVVYFRKVGNSFYDDALLERTSLGEQESSEGKEKEKYIRIYICKSRTYIKLNRYICIQMDWYMDRQIDR